MSGGVNVALARSDAPRAAADPSAANVAGTAIDAFGFDLYRRGGARDPGTDRGGKNKNQPNVTKKQ
jgi:hypothetical protein